MGLSVANSGTSIASRYINLDQKYAGALSKAMMSGKKDAIASAVDLFIGYGLSDNATHKKALATNMQLHINRFNTVNSSLEEQAATVQDMINIITSAGNGASKGSLEVLQDSLEDSNHALAQIIDFQKFDGKLLFTGNIDQYVQSGSNRSNTVHVKLDNLSDNKLYRTSLTNELIKDMKTHLAEYDHVTTAKEFNAARESNGGNHNTAFDAISGTNGRPGTTDAHIGTILQRVIASNNSIASFLDTTLKGGGIEKFEDATAVQITAAFTDNSAHALAGQLVAATAAANAGAAAAAVTSTYKNIATIAANAAAEPAATAATVVTAVVNALTNNDATATTAINAAIALGAGDTETALKDNNIGLRADLVAILKDGQELNINTTDKVKLAITADVADNMLKTIRAVQANSRNQKNAIQKSERILISSADSTKEAAENYLATDYLETTQAYKTRLQRISGSIAVLQGSQRIQEAAQKLLDGLAH